MDPNLGPMVAVYLPRQYVIHWASVHRYFRDIQVISPCLYVSKACQHRLCVLQITNNVYKENSKHVLHFWFKLRNCLGLPDTRLHKKIIPSTGGMYRYKYKYEECVGVWTTRAIVPRSQGQGGVVLLLRSCLPFTCFLARPWSR